MFFSTQHSWITNNHDRLLLINETPLLFTNVSDLAQTTMKITVICDLIAIHEYIMIFIDYGYSCAIIVRP